MASPNILAQIDNAFTYHAPKAAQIPRYALIRDFGKQFASHVAHNTPASREQSLAITKIEEAVMWANAAIARNETVAKNATDGTSV